MNTELTQAPIEQPEGQIPEEPTAHEDEAVEGEALVEEVSIDGMCGVY